MISKRSAVRDLYFKIKLKQPELTVHQVAEIIEKSPAPKFFCTLERARRVISLLDKGKEVDTSNPNKSEMFMAIHRKWVEYRELHEKDGKKLRYTDHLQEVLNSEAPSFFMSHSSIVNCISGKYRGREERCY